MKLAIASLSLLLAACNAPQPSSEPAATPQQEATAPAAAPATPVAEAPMAKRAPGQENADPLQIFRAFGTEPFWNVNVEDATLTYTTPEDQTGVVMQGTRRALEDGVELSGNHDGKAFVLTVKAIIWRHPDWAQPGARGSRKRRLAMLPQVLDVAVLFGVIMFSMFSGIVTPIAIGYIVGTTGSFNGALIYVGVHALVAVLSYLVLVGDIKRIELKPVTER